MSDESLVQVVARRWCKWPTAEGPCVAHVARAREMVSDLRLAGVDVTSPVDRLRKAGWTECACDGCPDSAHGLVPPDGMVEAAYSVLMGNGIHELPIDESDVRRALVAAARWEEAPGE